MNKDSDRSTRLGEVYKNLCGVNLTVEDLDLPVRVYNYLKRSGINDLQQILSMSEDDLINAGKHIKFGDAPRNCAYLIGRLEKVSKEDCSTILPPIGDPYVKAINRQLIERYKDILGETTIMAPFGQNGLSMPFLIQFTDEAALESADLRIMFFGQETREWTDKGTVTDVMERYRSDFNDFSNVPGSGVFWHVLSEMKNTIKERLPYTRISYIWNNIVKADYSPNNDYKGYKVPDEVYARFRDVNRALILSEIEIIKPDVLIFFTGAESSGYDEKIDDVFYHDTGISTVKEPVMIDGNENILAIAHLVVGTRTYDAYISYHPRALEIHQNAKEFVLNAIAEQCAKICEDGMKSIFVGLNPSCVN